MIYSGTIKLIYEGVKIRSRYYVTLKERNEVIKEWQKEFTQFEVQIKPDVYLTRYNIPSKLAVPKINFV